MHNVLLCYAHAIRRDIFQQDLVNPHLLLFFLVESQKEFAGGGGGGNLWLSRCVFHEDAIHTHRLINGNLKRKKKSSS